MNTGISRKFLNQKKLDIYKKSAGISSVSTFDDGVIRRDADPNLVGSNKIRQNTDPLKITLELFCMFLAKEAKSNKKFNCVSYL